MEKNPKKESLIEIFVNLKNCKSVELFWSGGQCRVDNRWIGHNNILTLLLKNIWNNWHIERLHSSKHSNCKRASSVWSHKHFRCCKRNKRLSLFSFTCNVKCHIYLFTKIYLYFFVRRGGLQIAVDSTECSVDNSDLFSWHKIYHSIEPRHP